MTKKLSGGMKLASVILGALLGGFMWRCRGEGGWGSSWGLCGVGLVMMLLIYHFYGNRKGMKFEMIPIGALFMSLGVTGYATVIIESSGILWSDLPYSGTLIGGEMPKFIGERGDILAPVNPVSGAAIIFIMGFTLVPLFALFITSLFSDKEYKIKDYVIVLVIFFVSSLIYKATIAHPILKLINPEQVQYALMGLKDSGYNYSSAMAGYMSHFMNRDWTQDIPFFENYYMSVEHVADFLAVITISIYALAAKKDKYTAFGALVIDALTALGTTAISPLMATRHGAGIFMEKTLPNWFIKISDWGVWEFGTGFFFGLFLMIFIAITENKRAIRSGDDDTPVYNDKKFSFVFNLLLCLWVLCITPARIVGIRFARLLEYKNILPDDEPLATILIVIVATILGIFAIKILNKNILKKGGNAVDMLPADFAKKLLPIYLCYCFVAYFFLDKLDILKIKEDITVPLMLITSALVAVIYIPVRLKLKKTK